MEHLALFIGYSLITTFITLLILLIVNELIGELIVRKLNSLGVRKDFIKRYLTKR